MRKTQHRIWFYLGRFIFKGLTTYLFSQMKYEHLNCYFWKKTKIMLKIIEYREDKNITV